MLLKDIVGHEAALNILKEIIKRDRIFPALLFAGPDGIGKSLVAINFAKMLNCSSAEDGPCETCLLCRKIDSGVHPDVFLIEPSGASNSIGIGEIRELIRRANLKPYEAAKKVFIIDKAHLMSDEAANAFLKTLEEPPRDTVFILTSRSKELLLPTIASRCYMIRFSSPTQETIKDFLMKKFKLDEEKAAILSNFSSGRIGASVRMNDSGLIEKKNRVIDSLFKAGRNLSDELGSYADKDDLKESLEFIISYLRDLFLYKSLGRNASFFNLDRLEDIKGESLNFSSERLGYLIKRLITLRSYIDANVNPKIIVDVLTGELYDGIGITSYA